MIPYQATPFTAQTLQNQIKIQTNKPKPKTQKPKTVSSLPDLSSLLADVADARAAARDDRAGEDEKEEALRDKLASARDARLAAVRQAQEHAASLVVRFALFVLRRVRRFAALRWFGCCAG